MTDHRSGPIGRTLSTPQQESLWTNRRWWRGAFILYAIALTVATHWPRLTIGPEIPATDKEIHTAAFALATFLLWMTRWQRRMWMVMLIALAWAGLDELTQAIPIIQRTCSWLDFLADAIGVALATLAIRAVARFTRSA